MGSESVSKELALAVRDSAVLSVVLRSTQEGAVVVAVSVENKLFPTLAMGPMAMALRKDGAARVEVMAGAPPIWGQGSGGGIGSGHGGGVDRKSKPLNSSHLG